MTCPISHVVYMFMIVGTCEHIVLCSPRSCQLLGLQRYPYFQEEGLYVPVAEGLEGYYVVEVNVRHNLLRQYFHTTCSVHISNW